MGRLAFNTKSFGELVIKESNNEIQLIDEYVNISTKIKFKCNKGHEFSMTPNRFRCGDRCPKCSGKYKPNTEEVAKEIKALYNGEYILTSEYKNNKNPIYLKHLKCGTENIKTSRDKLINKGIKEPCPNCRTKITFTNETYSERFYSLHKNLELLQNFDDCIDNKIKVRCKLDNHEWEANKYWIVREKQPTGCPICKSSQGEKRIKKFLEESSISFDEQKSFDDLKIVRKLKFDFCIYKNDKFFLLEYDGRLHFEPFSNSEESLKKFKDTQMRDKMKNDYCKEKGFKLVRINYKDFDNIEDILTNILNKM